MARKRNCCPLPACVINSRAAIRPIRPKPYRITSFGCKSILSAPTKSFIFEATKLETSFLKFAASANHSLANLPKSIRDGAKSNFAISLAIAKIWWM